LSNQNIPTHEVIASQVRYHHEARMLQKCMTCH
jgi:hypothetical protein